MQYYHRAVTLTLLGAQLRLLLDAEPMRPGEDEVAAGMRLLRRVMRDYPRALDGVAADSLYARADFFNVVYQDLHKHVMAVLKDEQRDLLQDARGLFAPMPPVVKYDSRRREWWDAWGFTTWPQCRCPVRVVRSHETWQVKRQLSRQWEQQESDWTWVTTLPQALASTGAAVQIGHSRWTSRIRASTSWSIAGMAITFTSMPRGAMLVMWLWTMLAANLFCGVLPAEPQAGGAGGVRYAASGADDAARVV